MSLGFNPLITSTALMAFFGLYLSHIAFHPLRKALLMVIAVMHEHLFLFDKNNNHYFYPFLRLEYSVFVVSFYEFAFFAQAFKLSSNHSGGKRTLGTVIFKSPLAVICYKQVVDLE